tara:strand:- start:3525 stop:4517 length:993 start_codon:yes stop_codon:yes gene_type:complete
MIVFGCNDVGPAKYLVELAKVFSQSSFCLAGELNKNIFERENLKVISNISELEQIKLVVTGTSAGDLEKSLDKKLLVWSKEHNIPSIAIVEHWTWAKQRFAYNLDDYLYPDYVVVNDLYALEDAEKYGVPKKIIYPLGNPYLEKLSNNKYSKKSGEKLKLKYNLPKSKRLIFFISEQIQRSLLDGTSDQEGYDEFIVLSDLLSCISKKDHLVIKIHPEESISKYKFLSRDDVTILRNCSVEEIATLADTIVGMSSMLLIELATFRQDIISYRPNNKNEFIGNKMKVTLAANTFRDLDKKIKIKENAEKTLKNYFEGSTERLTKFMLDVSL